MHSCVCFIQASLGKGESDKTDMSFKSKDPAAISEYLQENGISESMCGVFEENDIDGEAFLELTVEDVKGLLPNKLGIVKKICRLISQEITAITDSTPNPSMTPVTSPSPSLFSGVSDSTPSTSTPVRSQSAFKIPDNWRPSIRKCMSAETDTKKRQMLTTQVRNEIVRDLVTTMYTYMPGKPERDFCTRVAKMLVSKYPFLKDVGSTASGYGSWEKKILECVSNKYKKRQREGDSDGPPAKRGRPKSAAASLLRYPPYLEGEDDETSLQALKLECEKERPRKDVVLPLVKKTFSTRRNYILQEAKSVSAILSRHQELALSYVLEQEVDNVLEKKDILNTAVSDWTNKWVPAILAYAENCSGKVARASIALIKDLYRDGDACTEKIALTVLAKFLLPKEKKKNKKETDIESLLEALAPVYSEHPITDDPDEVARETTSTKVVYITNDQYYIMVEKQVLLTVDVFSEALMIWFVAHHVSTSACWLCAFKSLYLDCHHLPKRHQHTFLYVLIFKLFLLTKLSFMIVPSTWLPFCCHQVLSRCLFTVLPLCTHIHACMIVPSHILNMVAIFVTIVCLQYYP